MDIFADYFPQRHPLTLLDLGSGTGRLTPALAKRFGGPVFGVEPSDKMRAVAEAALHTGVSYKAGSAEEIPLELGSVDGVLMFLSFHHVRDRKEAAHEIARVLKSDGALLLRGVFGDRLPDVWWAPFFPGWQDMQRSMFPTLKETCSVFEEVGLRQIAFTEVHECYASTPKEAVERLNLRGISGFDHYSEQALNEGFEKLNHAFDAGSLQVPLYGTSDLLVLSR